MSCVTTIQDCIVRGDTYTRDVGLSTAFIEAVTNPADYEGVLVFRDYQSDALTPYLTLTVPVTPNPDYDPTCYNRPGTPAVYLHFVATPAQTQALPAYDIDAYCELRTVSVTNETVQRLFNETVTISD